MQGALWALNSCRDLMRKKLTVTRKYVYQVYLCTEVRLVHIVHVLFSPYHFLFFSQWERAENPLCIFGHCAIRKELHCTRNKIHPFVIYGTVKQIYGNAAVPTAWAYAPHFREVDRVHLRTVLHRSNSERKRIATDIHRAVMRYHSTANRFYRKAR